MEQKLSAFSYRLIAGAIVTLFAIGLTNDLYEPWIGLHDWNGAFYSQLARNLLRYPSAIHHGMGVVAMGETVPPPEERSIYATHPPGIVWLVAGAFVIGGQSEAVARCIPIAFSLGTMLLLMDVIRRRYGPVIGLLTGLIYGLTPMAVYFGRMVDQESPCLFLMLAAVACWDCIEDAKHFGWAAIGWGLSILAMVWIDWAGVLFAAFFSLWLLWMRWTGRSSSPRALIEIAWGVVCVLGMASYLVYSGFGGRWGDLWAVFTSRRGEAPENAASIWKQTFENLRWALIALACLGVVRGVRRIRDCAHSIPLDHLHVLCAAGLIWVLLFLRQYRIHQYWLYYLGPHIALAAAYGVTALFRSLHPRRISLVMGIAAMIWLAISGIQGTAVYFRRITCKPGDVEMWRQINAATAPTERVTLRFNPFVEERHGGYVFHNIVSAQLAYYMDRAVTVRRDPQ